MKIISEFRSEHQPHHQFIHTFPCRVRKEILRRTEKINEKIQYFQILLILKAIPLKCRVIEYQNSKHIIILEFNIKDRR